MAYKVCINIETYCNIHDVFIIDAMLGKNDITNLVSIELIRTILIDHFIKILPFVNTMRCIQIQCLCGRLDYPNKTSQLLF